VTKLRSIGQLYGRAADMDRPESVRLHESDIALLSQFEAGAEGGGPGPSRDGAGRPAGLLPLSPLAPPARNVSVPSRRPLPQNAQDPVAGVCNGIEVCP
jgi:hypothetical protein